MYGKIQRKKVKIAPTCQAVVGKVVLSLSPASGETLDPIPVFSPRRTAFEAALRPA
jgi:hypothetical protein